MSLNTTPLLREAVADALTELIISGEIAPGERLHELKLCERLGVSRSPLRDAFRRLESEGLVVTIPRRGTIVAKVTRQEVLDLYSCRIILQCEMVRLATPMISAEIIEILESIYSRMSQAAHDRELLAYLKLVHKFRETVESVCPNSVLVELTRGLAKRSMRLHAISVRDSEQVDRSLLRHRSLIDAFKKRDAEGASSITRQVMEEAKASILRVLD